MKLHTPTPIIMTFDDIPTDLGKIKIDDPTQFILKSFLMEYGIEPKNWRQIVTTWYKEYPYVSLKDTDNTAFMEFTIRFKLFLLGQLREIMDIENRAFAESYGRRLE
jgi:hypothetical protein